MPILSSLGLLLSPKYTSLELKNKKLPPLVNLAVKSPSRDVFKK
jgi:hypothetical protein